MDLPDSARGLASSDLAAVYYVGHESNIVYDLPTDNSGS